MNLLAPARGAVVRHPVTAFLLIGIGVYVAFVLVRPLVETEILPFELPLYGVLGGIFGVGLAAFVVTAATDGRAGVEDLARRTLRWRVPVRWFLIPLFGVPVAATLIAIAIYGTEAVESPPGGWPRALGAVFVIFVLQLLLFQLAEEIGWTGFLQDRWQDRYSPLKLSALVALPWAVWHLPDFFVDASISELSYDIVPGSNAARFLVLSGVIVVAATAVIVATRGRFARRRATLRAA